MSVRDDTLSVLRVLLGGSEVAIPLGDVSEIVRMVDLGVTLASADGSVRGAINVRGSIVPVVDLAPLFDQPPVAADPAHYIVIVTAGGNHYGLMASDTLPVAEVAASQRRAIARRREGHPAPEVLHIGGRLVPLLDTEVVFARES